MNIKMIVCVSKNGVIEKNNDLIFKIKEDLKLFKQRTLNKTIIMGRKTFESLPGILPGRTHIVLTNDKNYKINDKKVLVFNTVANILEYIGDNEVYIIGGTQIYNLFLKYTNTIYMSLVDSIVEGDTYFPKLNDDWTISAIEEYNEFKIYILKNKKYN